MEEIVIKIIELQKIYKQRSKKINALKGINLNINKGEIFGFLGPNGAGKSTTIKIMAGLIKPTQGKVLINNKRSENPNSRRRLGFLPENPSFIETLKGRELLLLSAKIHGIIEQDAKEKIDYILKLLSLYDAAQREIRKYSKGMIQKIGFASCIIHDPDILILDEPLSGLDPIARYQFKKIFRDLKDKGKTIFFSSHIIPDVEDLCDRIAIINKGKLAIILERSEIKNLEEIFINITQHGKI